MSLWNPPDLKKSCLPPCHVLYQWYVDTIRGTLSCHLYQRSGDVGLGVPFNIASASLLTMIFCKLSGLNAGELVHTIGDAHLYKNHLEKIKIQLGRNCMPFPLINIKEREQKYVEDFEVNDFELIGYICHKGLKMEMAV